MSFLRRSALFCFTALVAASAHWPAYGQMRSTVGVAAPLSGSSAILGEQMVAGAEAAAGEATAIETADTGCTAEGGTAAAERLIEAEVDLVIGFLCTEALLSALPLLSDANVPVIDVGVRANRITDNRTRTGFPVWRIAPRSDTEPRAIADAIVKRWRNEPFGLIEDGSIANRGLVDTVRRLVADEGLEPAATDNFRPAEEKQFGLVRRLARTGVTRFFIAGDRPDVAVIARDAAELDLDLDIIGGESLLDETSVDQPLAEGITAFAAPYGYEIPSKTGATRRVPGYTGLAYAATEIAQAAISDAARTERTLIEILNDETFQTTVGPVAFDDNGDANIVAYEAYRWTGQAFVPEGRPADAPPQ